MLEAICIQLPERAAREVVDLVPNLASRYDFRSAFIQSLSWRQVESISDRTCELVGRELDSDVKHRSGIVSALLTLATVPEHPLNARYLHTWLWQDSMAMRDSWWSLYINGSASGTGSARRLRDSALRVSPATMLDSEAAELFAIALVWMLTASHRSVRDWTTKALVNLLTGRLDVAGRLVERIANVDDPYLAERLYAVAYGVATRSHDAEKVGALAQRVYESVFARGTPPANILLRDFARGVVERALYLEAAIEVDETRIRPPYGSTPPVFPSEEDIASLLPSPDHDPHRQEGDDWARSHIGHSVFEGRLHREIRETWGHSGEWLELVLDEPAWKEPVAAKGGSEQELRPPTFNRQKIERYILERTFDLGWTDGRFGKFDSSWNMDSVAAGGNESIGRKYQLIAFREVLALIADNFQYREFPAGVERDHTYKGPWQNWLRDIDPTFTDRAPKGRFFNLREGNPGVWWTGGRYSDWPTADGFGDWVERSDELPDIREMLMVRCPADGTSWVNGSCYVVWKQKPSLGRTLFEEERGEVMYAINAFLTDRGDAEQLVERVAECKGVESGYDDVSEMHNVFMGEYAWAPASRYRQAPLGGTYQGHRVSGSMAISMTPVALRFPVRRGPLEDTGWDNPAIQIPSRELVNLGGLHWTGGAADFRCAEGNVVAFDPCAHTLGPSTLLLREDFVRDFSRLTNKSIVWVVVCVKSVKRVDPVPGYKLLRISGAYWLSEEGPIGSLHPRTIERQKLAWER
ncbi:MAG: hypothetical protein F4181_05215 [Proteobacteria bacterium]|nr:hypothetical protein [Pseudomonadota bacterium]